MSRLWWDLTAVWLSVAMLSVALCLARYAVVLHRAARDWPRARIHKRSKR